MSYGQLYSALLRHYGNPAWWPAESPFEVCMGAILTQNTSWTNVEKAINRLKRSTKIDPASIVHLGQEDLEELIKQSGFYRQKARRLLIFSRFILERCNGDIGALSVGPVEEVRRTLLQLEGIGDETADAIMVYACGLPVFVADAYSRRVLSRLGLVEADSDYAEVREIVEGKFGKDTLRLNRLHALLVEFSKDKCRKTPLCKNCFLMNSCPFGSRQLQV